MSGFQAAILPIVCALLGLSISFAHAGPCTAEISRFEKAIRDSASNPYAGLMAPQSVAAQIDRQPTPESLKQTQDRLRS